MAHDLNPAIDVQRLLIARRSCSMRLFRYRFVRTFTFRQLRMLAWQQPQRATTRRVSVERYFAWHAWECRAEHLAKEGLRRRDTAVAAKQKVDCLAVLVDGAVKIVPSRPDRNVRLIGPPRGADRFGKPTPALFNLRNIPRYPAKHSRKHSRVGNLNAPGPAVQPIIKTPMISSTWSG